MVRNLAILKSILFLVGKETVKDVGGTCAF